MGRNLADHPFFYLFIPIVRSARSRSRATSETLLALRHGLRHFAARSASISNWGMDVATFPPNSNVYAAAMNTFGKTLRRSLGQEIPRQLRVGYVIEQLPEPGNRVTISREFIDPIGCFRLVIHYNVSDYTRKAMISATKVSNALFHAMGIPDADIYTKFTPDSPGYMTYKQDDGTVAAVVLRFGAPHGNLPVWRGAAPIR